MVYKEYDNAELWESGIPCPSAVGDTCQFRNYFYTELGEPERLLSGISGNTNVLRYTDDSVGNSERATIFVRNDNYVYYAISNTGYGTYNVVEHNLDDDTEINIEVYNDPIASTYEGLLCFLENRKVVVYPDNDEDYSNVFLVDFNDETVTNYCNTINYIYDMKVIKASSGDLWVILSDYNSSWDGYNIKCRNYSQDGDWTIFEDSVPSGNYYPGLINFSSGKYAIITSFWDGNDDITSLIVNLEELTLAISNTLSVPVVTGGATWSIDGRGADGETGNIYYTAHGYKWTWTFSPPYRANRGESWYELDPVTATLTEIFSRVAYDIEEYYLAYIYTSTTNVYIRQYEEHDIYKANTLTLVGNYDFPLYAITSGFLDDNGPSFWYMLSTMYDPRVLYQININGSVMQSITTDCDTSQPENTARLVIDTDSIYYWEDQQQPSTVKHWHRLYRII